MTEMQRERERCREKDEKAETQRQKTELIIERRNNDETRER
jgi:hypothetical protein